jgi:hypothetical protein
MMAVTAEDQPHAAASDHDSHPLRSTERHRLDTGVVDQIGG